jgi:hypothetical protein
MGNVRNWKVSGQIGKGILSLVMKKQKEFQWRIERRQGIAEKWRRDCRNISKKLLGSLLSSLEESPKDLEGRNVQLIVPMVVLSWLSEPDETAFRRVRHRKRGDRGTLIHS